MTKRRMPYAQAREMMNGAARNQFCSYSKKPGRSRIIMCTRAVTLSAAWKWPAGLFKSTCLRHAPKGVSPLQHASTLQQIQHRLHI